MRLYGQKRVGCHFPGCLRRALSCVPFMLLCYACEQRLPQAVRDRYRKALPRPDWERRFWSPWRDKDWNEYLAARAEMLRACATIAAAERAAKGSPA